MQGGSTQTAAETKFTQVLTQLSVSLSTLLIVCGIKIMPREQALMKERKVSNYAVYSNYAVISVSLPAPDTGKKENALSAFLSKYFDKSTALLI